MKQFTFWYRWLLVVCLAIVTFGVLMAFLNQSEIFFAFNHHIDPVFWGLNPTPEYTNNFQGWIYGVLGATMAGWGVMLLFIVRNSFRQHEKWAWDAIMLSLGLWYFLDMSVSLYYGVIFNAIFNTILVVFALPPLWFTRKDFRAW